MKHPTWFVAVALFVSLFFGSCQSSSPAGDTLPPVAIHATRYYQAAAVCADTLADSLRVDLSSIALDTVPQGFMTDSLTAFIRQVTLLAPDGTPMADEAALTAALIGENRETYADPEFPCQGWSLTRKAECLLNADGLFSVSGFDFSYMGGAHPNTQITLRTFDLTTGLPVTVEQMVAPDKMPQLLEMVEQKFRKVYELADTTSWEEAGFWFNKGFVLPRNMALIPDGLYLIYNQYEVAPYAAGSTELIVEADEWMKVLTPEWQQRFARVRR